MKNYCSNLYVFWDFYMGLSENSVPLNPMVNDHYPYWMAIIGNIPRTQIDIVPRRLRPGSRGEGGRILRIADPALTRAQRGVTTWRTENGWIFVTEVGMSHCAASTSFQCVTLW